MKVYVATQRIFCCLGETRIFKLLSAQDSILRNQFPSLCSRAGRYDNPIPTRFLFPIDKKNSFTGCEIGSVVDPDPADS
jgi:hypothetical protein